MMAFPKALLVLRLLRLLLLLLGGGGGGFGAMALETECDVCHINYYHKVGFCWANVFLSSIFFVRLLAADVILFLSAENGSMLRLYGH